MPFLRTCLTLLMLASPLLAEVRLSSFSVEVTPPIGHPCMGGGIKPVERIEDPLYAHGFVLQGIGQPVVVVSVDWCEIRNDAYERWRTVLAQAAGTESVRVLVTAIHQHDTPIADLAAQRMLERAGAKASVCDLEFHEKTVQRVGAAVKASLAKTRPVSHIGRGQAQVEKVASNRRYLDPKGIPRFNRMSATGDPKIRDTPEGTIDPYLKTLSFWDGDQPLVALSAYATHPMSYYGRGGASSDFVGLARGRRQSEDPQVLQIYASGCSGNVTAGKYNDGNALNRPILAGRIFDAMKTAWKNTQREPIQAVAFRSEKLRFEPRDGPGFTSADLQKKLETDPRPFNRCLAARGLSWRQRADQGATIDVPALDFGFAVLTLLPAESYVEYQLMAQQIRPQDFVVVMGYGECAPGYIPTDQAVRENDGNLYDWNWVAPGSEGPYRKVLEKVLKK